MTQAKRVAILGYHTRALDAGQIMAEATKHGGLFRQAEVREVDEESRTVELAFSSELPVARWFGEEVLDHDPASIRLDRLEGGAAVLINHDWDDQVGVVESVDIGKDRRGRAKVRFGRGARANEIWQDVVDGIRKHVSVGYLIHKVEVESRKGQPDLVRVTDWEPYEISLVSVPADPTVGVGRSADPQNTPEPKEPEPSKGTPMKEKILRDAKGNLVRARVDDNGNILEVLETIERAEDRNKLADNAIATERERVRGLMAVGEQYNAVDLARQFIDNGGSESDLNKAILERMGKSKPIEAESPELGLSDQEVRQFSIVRALNALANPDNLRARKAAAYEFEVSAAACERMGRESRGLLIPVDVLKRGLTVGTAADGGDLVATDLLSGSFIDLLRNRALMMQLGTTLMDLNGNIAIPRQSGGATAYWVAEDGAPTESKQGFDQVALSPKTVGAFTVFSRKLLLQSSLDIESLVRSDLATVLALAIDQAAISGTGASNQPTGILNVTGIGDVAGGTNGAAPTWGNIIDLETEVAIDNADLGRLAYVTNTKVRGKLKQTEKASGTAQFVWNGAELNGYSAQVTNQVPSNLTKGTANGVCSAIIFGNWADLLIGMWGGLDLQVNPYSLDTTGGVRVTAFQDVDIAVRHPESFAAMQDALTA